MYFCRTAIIVFAISVGCTNAYGLSAADQKEVAYVGATVFDGIGAAGRPDMVIVTRADRIAAILPGSEYRTKRSREVVSLRRKVIIPGLVDSHVHLATLAKPSAAKAYLRRELYSGVTAVRDMAGDARLLGKLKREAEFDEIPSPDIYYAAVMAVPAFFTDPPPLAQGRWQMPGWT
jgi:hypothetical protein